MHSLSGKPRIAKMKGLSLLYHFYDTKGVCGLSCTPLMLESLKASQFLPWGMGSKKSGWFVPERPCCSLGGTYVPL